MIELAVQPRLALNYSWQSYSLGPLLSAGPTGVCQYAWLTGISGGDLGSCFVVKFCNVQSAAC